MTSENGELSRADEPPIHVKHADLVRIGDSMYRSKCPVCSDGHLLVNRDQVTMDLLAADRCVLCGQLFIYDDIEEMREREDKENHVATFEEVLQCMILSDPRLCEILKSYGVLPSNVLITEAPREALQALVSELYQRAEGLARLVEDFKTFGVSNPPEQSGN